MPPRPRLSARVFLLCHAPTDATRALRFPNGESIEDGGRRRATRCRPPVAERYLTSPVLAARETAEALRLSAEPDPSLRECDYGRWAGRSLDAVQAEEPEGFAAWLTDPGASPHGGESVCDLIARVGGWLDARPAGRTLAVTHAAVIRAAIVHAIAAAPQSFWRINVSPLAVAELSGGCGRWTLVSVGPIRSVAP